MNCFFSSYWQEDENEREEEEFEMIDEKFHLIEKSMRFLKREDSVYNLKRIVILWQ